MRRFGLGALAGICVGLVAAMAPAPQATAAPAIEMLAKHRDWRSYRGRTDGGQTFCFIASVPRPQDSRVNPPQGVDPSSIDRGDTYVMVTHWPDSGDWGVVSVEAGYPYQKDSKVQIQIGRERFTLTPAPPDGAPSDAPADKAWTSGADEDRALIEAMKRGSRMTVIGRSWRPTETIDGYSLMGFTAALGRIDKACNR